MFDFSLAINLTAHTFSMKKGSLRFPTPTRIFSALIILPSFFILIIVNKIFMALDWIIFPGFTKIKVRKSGFIIGVARSATTYLYNILAKDTTHFTCFKLWEILFAPSILQKYIFVGIIKIDMITGRPLYKLSLLIDKLFLGKISILHDTSLSKPEEDEMLLIYAFATMYLAFFFPDVPALDRYLFFDEGLSAQKRKKLIGFYKRCVQRHIYVFDRKEEKYFLSKNPAYISKTATISEIFPDAKLLYMLRSPLKTIPSTISLNLNVYSLFSGKKKENPLAGKTTEAIIRWYRMAEKSIDENWQNRNITVPFKKITRKPETTVNDIYDFLNIVPEPKMVSILKNEQERSGRYRSLHKYSNKIDQFENEINSGLHFIFNGKYRDEI